MDSILLIRHSLSLNTHGPSKKIPAGISLTQLLGVFPPGVAVTGRYGARTGATHAATCPVCFAPEQKFELIQLGECLAGDTLGEFRVLTTPFGGVQPLGSCNKILIFAVQLRIARQPRPELAKLPLNLVEDGLSLRLRPDFRRALRYIAEPAGIAWVAAVAAAVIGITASQLTTLAGTTGLAAALWASAAALLITGPLLTTALVALTLLILTLLTLTLLALDPADYCRACCPGCCPFPCC